MGRGAGRLLPGLPGPRAPYPAARLPRQDLTEAGLSVFTNLEPRIQELAEQILDRELTR